MARIWVAVKQRLLYDEIRVFERVDFVPIMCTIRVIQTVIIANVVQKNFSTIGS